MSGNFKIRYTMPLGSGPAIASKLESYFQSGADSRLDLSQGGVQPLANYNFQRALHKTGIYTFDVSNGPVSALPAQGCVIDLSGGYLRVRRVDASGNIGTNNWYIDISTSAIAGGSLASRP